MDAQEMHNITGIAACCQMSNPVTISGRLINLAGTEGTACAVRSQNPGQTDRLYVQTSNGACHICGVTITHGCTNAGGGGIFGAGALGGISNCIINNNTALDGGGLYDCDGPINNCAITGNSAKDGDGNAMACDSRDQQYPGYLQLTNCILWDGGDEVWNNDNSAIAITYTVNTNVLTNTCAVQIAGHTKLNLLTGAA